MSNQSKEPTLPSSEKYTKLLKDIRDIRAGLKSPDTREHQLLCQEEAIKIFQSEEFGNFISLSTLYDELHKASE